MTVLMSNPNQAAHAAIDESARLARRLCISIADHYAAMATLCHWLRVHTSLPADHVTDLLRLGFLITGTSSDDAWPTVTSISDAEDKAAALAADQRTAAGNGIDAATAQNRRAINDGIVTLTDITDGIDRTHAAEAMLATQVSRFYLALCEQPWAQGFLGGTTSWGGRSHSQLVGAHTARMTARSAIEFLTTYSAPGTTEPRDLYLAALLRADPAAHGGDRVGYDSVLAAGAYLHSVGRL
ncbi:hypothetical protein [Gordonia malaquae]